MTLRGFTLIELLIVIAIILILIAIALPNFLEAQIRAKVTNAKGELRSLQTALTTYSIDYKIPMADGFERVDFWGLRLDPRYGNAAVEGDLTIWAQITTPTKYVSTLPTDDFMAADKGFNADRRYPENNVYRYYSRGWRCLASGNSHNPKYPTIKTYACKVAASARGRVAPSPFDPEVAYAGSYIILSPGPDRFHNAGEWAMYRPYVSFGGGEFTYAPTNGTTSKGDLSAYGKI
jgi:prepilin-type N-terminal cleavage/methylation domain-containing protein